MQTFDTPAGVVTVSADHPGGNGSVEAVSDGTIHLRPETRDFSRAWFYWNVAVESPVAQRLRIALDGDHVSPRGPAVRCESGPWQWLGAAAREDDSTFAYEFDRNERVQFALAPAYQVADFAAARERIDGLDVASLTTSECGRDVPLVRAGDDDADARAVVTCRHHACESTASYVLEGFLAAVADGALPDGVAVDAVPFVDVDGVERGDQGKHRAPHDHNRDYVEANALTDEVGPIYRSTAAVMDHVETLAARDELVAGLDLHCPFKWGGDNDRPFLVESPEHIDGATDRLVDALADATADARLSYDPTPGTGVLTFDGQGGLIHAFSRFADRAGADLATTLEIPYVGTEDDPVTPASSRQFGVDLAHALDSTLVEY